jgi:hypothetical protein
VAEPCADAATRAIARRGEMGMRFILPPRFSRSPGLDRNQPGSDPVATLASFRLLQSENDPT